PAATPPLSGRIARIARAATDGPSGVEVRAAGASTFQPAGPGARIEPGATVRTDARTRVRLELGDGSSIVLNHGTELVLAAGTGIGALRAHKPGEDGKDHPLRLARHKVTVRIAGAVARTEIEEVFHNDGGEVLEGVYRFPLPAGARIDRLALEVDGRLEEG